MVVDMRTHVVILIWLDSVRRMSQNASLVCVTSK